MNKTPLPSIAPRGLNIRQASAYWGVSPGTFKKLVERGLAPAPLKMPGLDRNIFDKVQLDRAMDSISGIAPSNHPEIEDAAALIE